MFEIQYGMTRFGSVFIHWDVHSGSLQSDDMDSSIVLKIFLWLFLESIFFSIFSASLSAFTLVIGCSSITLMEYLLSVGHCDTSEVNRSHECLDSACPRELYQFLSFCTESGSRKLMFFLKCVTQKGNAK